VNLVGTVASGAEPFVRIYARAKALALSDAAGEAVAILLLTPLLLGVAVWNGFPLIFYDTGAYILEGLGHVFVAERSPVYSLLLRYAGAAHSLWTVAALQAVLSAFVMTEFARAEMRDLQVWKLGAIVAVLCLVTGIGWYVGQIEPDCMTALAVLALYLLAFRVDALGWGRAVPLVAIAALANATHPAHVALAAGLILCAALLRLAAMLAPGARLPAPKLALSAASFVLALVLVLSANYELTDSVFFSRSGSVFAFARMLQDGLIKRLLDDTCPESHFKMCAFKDKLPDRADAFLWDANSPFNKLDRFYGPVSEYGQMVAASIEHYPLANLGAALKDTAVQFVKIRTGDQIEPQEWILYSDLAHYVPGQMNAYMSARQQQGRLRFVALNLVHVSVAILSLFGLLALIWQASARRDWHVLSLPAFILLALLGNAFVCGVFSNPHDRYQSRLVWVPTFVLLLSAPKTAPRVLAKLNRIRHLMPDA
jgi:hypothetical protein